jgi:hypothetical protein
MLLAQPAVFKENLKWGIRENAVTIIPPVFDTVFNFDPTGKVCLACFKAKNAVTNRFIKVQSTTFTCNYLNKKNERLKIRNGSDTCSVFTFAKNTVSQYADQGLTFVANVKGQKHLITKDFKQLTRMGYVDVALSPVAGFYITQQMSEAEVVFTGLINLHEDEVVPYQYSAIRINPYDSLIIACSAGVRPNADDDLYDYSGKRIASYRRHIDIATKHFIIHKLYEPKEHFVLYNVETGEEKTLVADEVAPAEKDEILVRIKNDWYLYDLKTNLKKPTKQS